MTITFYRQRSLKERLWKSLNILVGVATITNLTMVGVWFAPSAAQAQEAETATVATDAVGPTNAGNPPTIAPNPPLGQTCGLDIGLIVDRSGSVDSGEMAQMKTALQNFAGAFTGTPTIFSLSSFATNATQNRAFSQTPAQMSSDIGTDIPAAGDGNTNWDSGLQRGFATFDPRPAQANLLVIATDGSPNRWGYPTATPTFDWNGGLNNAIPTANAIKNAGTRIVVVGIGDDTSDPATPAQKLDKMKSISGPTVATTTAQINASTDVMKVTDFSGIGSALAAYASELCGGKILVQKQFDTNGDDVADLTGNVADPLLGGYAFDVNGSSSHPAPQVTGHTGSLEYTVLNSTYALTESNLPAGRRFISAQCVKGTQPIGTLDAAAKTISGLTLTTDETISCTVLNGYTAGSLKVTKVVGSGSAWPHEFGFRLLGSGGAYTFPANGQDSVVFSDLQPGTYSIEETGPNGYHQSNTTCPNVQVTAGQQATCNVTNDRDTGRLSVTKHVDTNGDGAVDVTGATDWTWDIQGGEQNVATGDGRSLVTGSYTISEDQKAGYHVTNLTCNGQDLGAVLSTQVRVGTPGTSCTFTNTRDTGTLVVSKNVINPDGVNVSDRHAFMVQLDGGLNKTVAEGTNAIYVTLPTGSYTVTELADGGYTFVSYSADADNNAGNGAQVAVEANQTTNLLVTNQQKKVEIVVHKNVVALDGPTDVSDNHSFTASVNGANGTISESQTYSTFINPGAVTVTEQADPNYALVNIAPDQFTVLSGDQPVQVMVTNKQKAATITVYKDVRAWDGSDINDGTNFNVTLGGVEKTFSEGAPAIFAVSPGTYSATETGMDATAYTLKSIDPAHVTVSSNGQAAITVTNWQNKKFDWLVSKADSPDPVQAGGQLDYTMTWQVGQSSNTQLSNLVVTDPLPPHTAFVSANLGGTYNAVTHSVTWNIPGPFIPGQTGQVMFTVMVEDHLNPVVLTNTATICGIQSPYVNPLTPSAVNPSVANPAIVCNDATTTTHVLSSYHLHISKTDNQITTTPGATSTYDLPWSITGNAATTSAITIIDNLPANVTYVSSSNGGVYDSANHWVTWNLGNQTVLSGDVYHITVKAKSPLSNGTVLTNTATICDTQPVCDSGDDTTTVQSSLTVNLDKTGPATITPGSQMTYILNWSVTGNSPVDALVLTDTLPANTMFVSASHSGVFDATTKKITWNLGPQLPSTNGAVMLLVQVASPLRDGTIIANAADVCAESIPAVPTGLPKIKHCHDDTTSTEVDSDFTVTLIKTDSADPVQAGANLTYTLNWSAAGHAPIDSLIITDPLPANTTFVSAANGGTYHAGTNTVTWNLGAKNPGDTGSVTLIVKVASVLASGTVLTNVGTVCGSTLNAAPQTVQRCSSDDEKTTVQSAPQLSITKLNNVAGFTNPGKIVTYTVIVANTAGATDAAQAVVMTDVLPSGFTFSDGTATRSFTLGNIAPGASVTTSYAVTVSAAQFAGVYTNTASAHGSNTASVAATSNVEVRIPQILGSAPEPKLTLAKSVTPTESHPGHVVTYTLVIKNIGDTEATNVEVTDTLPAGFTFIGGGKASKTWTISTLRANHERVINYEAMIDADSKAGTYKNVAIVTADGLDPVKVSRRVTVTVPKVLGLVDTGVGPIDYALFILGLATVSAGALWFSRFRQNVPTLP